MESPEEHPLNYKYIRDNQQTCKRLEQERRRRPNMYFEKELAPDVKVICYASTPANKDEFWRIALPDNILKETIEWFHIAMGHPDRNRLREFLQTRYYNITHA